MKTKEIEIDAIAMKREGAARIYEQIKGMTVEQQVAFWRERSEALRKRRAEILKKAVVKQ